MEISPQSLFNRVFETEPDIRASAPGRIEIIGNHTDYNGGLVLGAAVDMRLTVDVRARTDERVRIATDFSNEVVETSMSSYRDADLPAWSRYPLGVLDEFRMHLEKSGNRSGFDLAIESALPAGVGLSSSAALEMATGTALNELYAAGLDRMSLVRMAHRAENRFVGVPCGLLDQAVCGMSEPGSLVLVDAARGHVRPVSLPAHTRFVLCTSHVSRSLAASPYEERHRECRNALMALERFIPGLSHLANLHPLDTTVYGPALDPVLRKRATHVVSEQFRVREFIDLLKEAGRDGDDFLQDAGTLLTSSHQSSRLLFDNSSPELDFLVDRFVERPGALGARLTGAGWGGSVVAWVTESFDDELLDEISSAYVDQYEVAPRMRQIDPSGGARLELA